MPVIYFADSRATGANDGSSWEDAFTDLATACLGAYYCDEIWCNWCIFKLTETPIVQRGARLYGGFPNGLRGTDGDKAFRPYHTTIDGQGTHRCLVIRHDTIVDGFDLRRGFAIEGGGILFYDPD